MLGKIFIACLFLVLVLADPVPEKSARSVKGFGFLSDLLDTESTEDVAVARFEPTTILDLLGSVIDFKSTALQIAVNIIEWLVSNSLVIGLSLLVTFGFCKLTDKCNFNYEQYVPVDSMAQFRSLATPERLEQAEQFLVTAMEKYAQRKKRSN
ncbi:hypothetical protein MSG28_008011 [Choristoneura fumiferana]|uniref:Uncharacterized protein n=1 Tax=Choristoneura fumiferana TaxID=7141 RepID=A0ACC0J9J0_CHOFU|nr:hypothetical protein MSG28_008011 [Choristoneura fumiferana]